MVFSHYLNFTEVSKNGNSLVRDSNWPYPLHSPLHSSSLVTFGYSPTWVEILSGELYQFCRYTFKIFYETLNDLPIQLIKLKNMSRKNVFNPLCNPLESAGVNNFNYFYNDSSINSFRLKLTFVFLVKDGVKLDIFYSVDALSLWNLICHKNKHFCMPA